MKNKFDIHSPILLVVLMLLFTGVVMVYSASSFKAQELYGDSNFFLKAHFYKVLLGVGLMLITASIPYKFWLKISPVLMFLAVCLLLFLIFSPGTVQVRGSKRWLNFGLFQFQPSDFARIALILFLSYSLSLKKSLQSDNYHKFFFHLLMTGIVIFPILVQPDVGTALIISIIALSIIFVSGEKLRYLFSLVVVAAPLTFFILMQTGGYQKGRIVNFWHSMQGTEIAWQTQQSLIAFGNGHWGGLGLGSGKQKYHFLPDPFTDFIYSIVGEELGLIGAVLILILFCILIWYGFQIATNSNEKQGKLLAFGIIFNIAIYALTNAGVVLNLLPTTGIPMPFMSYGGSALLTNLFLMGILLNLSSENRKKKRLVPVKNHSQRRVVMLK